MLSRGIPFSTLYPCALPMGLGIVRFKTTQKECKVMGLAASSCVTCGVSSTTKRLLQDPRLNEKETFLRI